MKSTILRYLLLLAILLPQTVSADRMGYYIRNYHVDAVVHKNNVWDITETVDLTFTEPRHGFYRYVPYTFKQRINVNDSVSRLLRYVGEIENESVDGWAYEVEDKDENVVFRIGSADRTVAGDQTYVIHYSFAYPEDRIERYTDKPWDFIHHTLLPNDCNVPIEHFSFNVRYDKALPIDFKDRLKVYYGMYGQDVEADGRLVVDVKDNAIIGYMDSIPPLHTVTIYAPLEEGFFESPLSHSPVPCVLLFGVTMLFIIATLIAELTSKHPSITKTIEFYPPDDISSAEVGTIIDESADLKDLASLIPWWAGKGYITIDEQPGKSGLFGKGDPKLTLNKLKDLPNSAPKYQHKFFNMLFGSKDSVVLNDMGEHPDKVKEAQQLLNGTFTGERKLTSASWKNLFVPVFLITGVITFVLGSAVEVFEETTSVSGVFLWFAPAIAAVFIVAVGAQYQWVTSRLSQRLMFSVRAVLALCALCFHAWLLADEPESFINTEMLAAMYIGAFAAIELMPRLTINTPYRAELMGKLLGLKEFIETADKPQLESLQHDDPQYFYRILPYAMVFGITDKWTKLFKDIEVEQPQWYHTQSMMQSNLIASNIASAMSNNVANSIKVISHDSTKSSGGGSSFGGGGGVSGGGGGGGGCGSW